MRRFTTLLVAVVGVGLWVGTAYTGDPKDEHKHEHGHQHDHGDQHAYEHMPQVSVTDQHKVLLEGVGEWKVIQKHWMMPGSEPSVAYGKSMVKKMLDGQAILFEYESTGDMGDFKGFGTATWNTITKQYEGTWIDVFSCDGLDTMSGVYNPATKTLTWTSSWTMPDGSRFPTRMVEKMESKDKSVSTFYMTAPDGNEFKTMELVYTRVK